jgi:phosphoribosylformylglycinamidine synthase
MAAKVVDSSGQEEIVKSPGALVVSAYATCPDITKIITPDIKKPGGSRLLYVDLGGGRYRLGGSALAQVYGQIGNETPDVDNPGLLKKAFNVMQRLIDDGLIIAGHDRSDGGLIVSLLEMAFAGNCGVDIDLNHTQHPVSDISSLFSEELGLVAEYLAENEAKIIAALDDDGIAYELVGRTTAERNINITINNRTVLSEDMKVLRAAWEETSYHLDRLQANPDCVDEERKLIFDRKGPGFNLTFTPLVTRQEFLAADSKPKVAIVREEGSNGDREMTSAFHLAGFEAWDVTMTDLLAGKASLNDFRGVAFVGGFSYADVLDSAKGWAGVIRFHKALYEQFNWFYERPDTFSLGVCNGCQLMALLGWVPWRGIPDNIQPRFIRNKSGRFESRFSTVRILPGPAIMLRGMEGSTLGVWVAHGEGRLYSPDGDVMQDILRRDLAQIRFVDDSGECTDSYPFNPNGSPSGIAALCSPDGRHLAMMPHPERTFLKWQWAHMPEDWKKDLDASPWIRLFQNAREWCCCGNSR